MDEATCLSKMVAPRDTRHGIWRGGIVQCFITRNCNLRCANCSQMSQLSAQNGRFLMTPDTAELIFRSLKDANFVVGIFGGAPPLNKFFSEICEVMCKWIPFERRGLWTNNLFGKGDVCRKTFCPHVSNLNLHMDVQAEKEFRETWPESIPVLKGMDQDSRHGPPYVAAQDLDRIPNADYSGTTENTEANRLDLISQCHINRWWSSLACSIDGKVFGFFCEIAAAMAMHHVDEPEWNIGIPIDGTDSWWNNGMDHYKDQVRKYCHACGVPLKGYGDLAVGGKSEQVSPTHAKNYTPKDRARPIELVTRLEQLGDKHLPRFTDYIQNSSLPILN